MASHEDTADHTLSMLEERLRRLDFLLNGYSTPKIDATGRPPAAVSTRLHNLERSLNALINRSNAAYDILLLQQQIPDLFHPSHISTPSSTLAPASLAQLILAHEELYKSTSTQLQKLNDIGTLPDTAPFAKLIAEQPRIEKLEAQYAIHAREFAELRARSAQIVEQWYEAGVLQMAERWADWEERLRDCEILIRRQEAARKREQELV